ncbi:hypothetical protein ACFX13_042211 [Malus domestica]|uniref:Transketolase-like pyrimidine-binding domain-containing protein n=1 Tax=Malus domestica TaxID=3750 RepID=A0A498JLW3_MALDO|nr:pyruvate dehydrogenase E1 component subunit beta-1, mitochondrial-like [Malus domestica]RXH94602.1 hypothetical protein DVH24_024286 [Malus domestica]
MTTKMQMAGFTGIGVGVAYYGLRPIVEAMTFIFPMRAILLQNKIMSDGAVPGFGAQHSQMVESLVLYCWDSIVQSNRTNYWILNLTDSTYMSREIVQIIL